MLQEEKIINYIKKKQNQKARIESELTQLELMIDILKKQFTLNLVSRFLLSN